VQTRTQTRTIDIPRNACQFAAASASVDGDRFTLVPFAGQQFAHWYWGQMTFDIEGMSLRKNVIPAFKDHDPSQLVGEIDDVKVGKSFEVSGTFLDTEAAKQIRATQKLEWECSLAFDLGSATIEEVQSNQKAEVNGQSFSGPGFIVRKAALCEVSFTFFGQVPGTKTKFANDEVLKVSVQQQEVIMSDEATKVDGRAEALGLFAKMNEMSEDKAFVAECFAKGMTIEAFQSALIKQQTEKIAKLSADLAAKSKQAEGVPALTFSAEQAKVEEKEMSFVELAHKVAKDEKVSLREAYSKVAHDNPALYKAHIEACPISRSK
jgi:hypothetical protein